MTFKERAQVSIITSLPSLNKFSSTLAKNNNAMYNPSHETNPQTHYSHSSRRYKRVLETCHGLRLNDDVQSPETDRFGTFLFSVIARAILFFARSNLQFNWKIASSGIRRLRLALLAMTGHTV
jgi:hypothetical protein